MLWDIALGILGLALLIGGAIRAIARGATIPVWGWFWVGVITAGMTSTFFGLRKAREAGVDARAASQAADRVQAKYAQTDQSAALRTCLRLALDGKDCEGGDEKDGDSKKGKRAEACGYREDRCMTTEELNAFGKCMRGDEL